MKQIANHEHEFKRGDIAYVHASGIRAWSLNAGGPAIVELPSNTAMLVFEKHNYDALIVLVKGSLAIIQACYCHFFPLLKE